MVSSFFAVGGFGLRPQHSVEDVGLISIGRILVFSLEEGHALGWMGGYPVGYGV